MSECLCVKAKIWQKCGLYFFLPKFRSHVTEKNRKCTEYFFLAHLEQYVLTVEGVSPALGRIQPEWAD